MKHLLDFITLALAGALGLAFAPSRRRPSAQTKLKLVLNWKYQGPQGWFFLAEDQRLLQSRGT